MASLQINQIMNKTILTIALIGIASICFSQNARFTNALQEGLLEFKMPENFDTVAIEQNPEMNYELALRSKSDSFEIRYAIRPLKKRIAEFEKMASDTSKRKVMMAANAHPNKIYKMVFTTVLINTSIQKNSGAPTMPRFGEFPSAAVKQEFNADWGGTTGYEPRPTFAKNYKNCLTVALHKDDAADIYIFYLFNDRELMKTVLPPVFHTIKFK